MLSTVSPLYQMGIWFMELSVTAMVGIAFALSAILAFRLGELIYYRRERNRRVREYQQALLDFRWHEGMSPIEFEQCCADYLRLRGWESTTSLIPSFRNTRAIR
jgi:hypothetical protein